MNATSLTTIEGKMLNLTCNVETSDVISNYTWYFNNQQLTISSQQMLQLHNVNRTDSGNYSCKVTTKTNLQNTGQRITITVLCKYLLQ